MVSVRFGGSNVGVATRTNLYNMKLDFLGIYLLLHIRKINASIPHNITKNANKRLG
jgi:hypothetical protein